MASAEPVSQERRALLKTAGLGTLAAFVVPVAGTLTSRPANANGVRVTPQQINPYIDRATGDFVVQQPTAPELFSGRERDLILGAVMGEIAEVVGMPRNSDQVAIARRLTDETKEVHDVMAIDSLVSFANRPKRYMSIVATSEPVADAIHRALSKPEIRPLAGGIHLSFFTSYRPGVIRSAALDARRTPQ